MFEIPLPDGRVAIVDDEDMGQVRVHRWYSMGSKGQYVGTHIQVGGVTRSVYLHRFILDAPTELEVDHINHDRLDNRRANLRFATRSQNEQNGNRQRGMTGYRGVTYEGNHPRRKPYRAQIGLNGKHISLGYYATPEEAAAAAANGRRLYMTHAPECTTVMV